MSRGLRLRATAWFVTLAMFSGVVPGSFGAICAVAGEATFIAPVDGLIVRRFEPPPAPFAAGHRGIDFGVPVGTQVVASGDGTVVFAGPVADDGLFVTIAHQGLIQTTYSFMSEILVSAGQQVKQSDPIGLSGEGHPGEAEPVLHFGAKMAGEYFDPEILLFGNLDDISDLISLAPIDDELGNPAIGPGGRPLLGSSFKSPAKLREPKEPWHVKLGSMIGGVGRGVRDATVGVARWTKDKAMKVGRFTSGVLNGIGDGIGMGFRGVKNVVKATGKAIGSFLGGAKRFVVGVGRALRSAAAAIADVAVEAARWVGRGAKWIGGRLVDGALWLGTAAEWVGSRVVDGVQWLGRGVVSVGKYVVNLGRNLWNVAVNLGSMADVPGFVVGMGKGAVEQIQCSRKGGAPPPDLPTTEELDAGVKSPPPPPNDNIVIAVAGIGSHTAGENGKIVSAASMYQLDFQTLGYSEDQVFNFSYRGIEDRGGTGPYRIHAPFEKEDTYRSIARSAVLLRQQIEEIHQLYPDKKIDLVAHSQGGLVAQYFVTFLYQPYDEAGLEVEHFVSIATPHQGADAAQVHGLLSDNSSGRTILRNLDAVAEDLGFPPPSVPSAREMAEDSPFIVELNRHWDPEKVNTTTIADTVDFVVTPQHTRLKGADNYTADMPGDAWKRPFRQHGDIVSASSTKEIMYNALADTPSECTALRNAFADYGPGKLISSLEDSAAALIELGSEAVP